MVSKIYIVTDLGPGDGGKGGVVHRVSTMKRSHTVVKVGGSNGSHGVFTSRGDHHAFSLWGCGTFEGIKTHLSSRFIVSPEGILNEEQMLRYQSGVQNAFDLLSVDRDALCSTEYHGIISRVRELARGNHPRGTIGTGVGVALRDSERFPDLAIHVRDLSRPDLRDLLVANRIAALSEISLLLETGHFLEEDSAILQQEVARLNDERLLEHLVHRFREVSERVNIVDHEFLKTDILSRDGVVVVETSHGILTDRYRGFHPHTSANRTLPRFTHAMLKEAGYDGQIVNLGVTRAYQIRHGAGPLPTDDPDWVEHMLPGSHKEENRYQGRVRIGALDTVLLRYAIANCGGPQAFDGLAITWFDQVQKSGEWKVCDRYQGADDLNYFTQTGDIIVRTEDDQDQLKQQENLTRQLLRCTPEITTHQLDSNATRDQLYDLCASTLKERLGVPVRMVSFGPTELDKMCK